MVSYVAFPNFLWLWLLPAVGTVIGYGLWQRGRSIRNFASGGRSLRLIAEQSLFRTCVKVACILVAIALAICSLAQPQWGTYWTQQRASGRDIFLALDVSRSMLAEDVTPSRLERAKADIRDLVAAVEESGGHRLGLIAFAGSASVKCPLTQVYSHFRLVLDGLGPGSIAQGGTLIGDCIRAAIDAFDDKTQNFRDLILITDGEDMDSFPLEAAAAARDAGIAIYTIGLGDPAEGARIPVTDKAGRSTYLEHKGQVVWSKLNEEPLRQIAQITGGIYVPAGIRAIELDRIFREMIEPKTKRDLGETRRERLHDRFQWFLAPAVVLLFLEALMRETRHRTAPSPLPLSLGWESEKGVTAARAQTETQKAESPLSPWGRGAGGEGFGAAAFRTPGQQSLLPLLLVSLPLAAFSFPDTTYAEDAASLVRQGNQLYEQGKYADAAQLYDRASQLAPDSPVPLHNHAAALFQSGDFAAAAKLYEQARARAPQELRQKINYALGNCHLEQATRSQGQLALASQEAKTAVQFYRDALTSVPTAPGATEVSDNARHNLELAKRLMQQLEQQRQPPSQQQQDRNESKNKDPQNQSQQKQSPQQGQPQGDQQPATDNPQQQPQPQPSEAPENQSPAQTGPASEQLSPDEAADRLRTAIGRAQMARARRLSEQAKQTKGRAVERDW
ncbi:MAG: VWA domain-containing protein [Planctomycetes bacterium]|nr:VWA domain-containing protein [Planctomycetota bacterium]